MIKKKQQDNLKYSAESIKVLKGLEQFEKDLECILVIPMMEQAFTIWFTR